MPTVQARARITSIFFTFLSGEPALLLRGLLPLQERAGGALWERGTDRESNLSNFPPKKSYLIFFEKLDHSRRDGLQGWASPVRKGLRSQNMIQEKMKENQACPENIAKKVFGIL